LYVVGADGRAAGAAACKYKVIVYTSDIKFAGTDANVAIELRGEKGNSGRRKLASSKNDFERGQARLPPPSADACKKPAMLNGRASQVPA